MLTVTLKAAPLTVTPLLQPTIQQLDDVGQPDVADETLYERFEATLTEIAQDLVSFPSQHSY